MRPSSFLHPPTRRLSDGSPADPLALRRSDASGQKLVILLAQSPPSPTSRLPSLLTSSPSLLLASSTALNLPLLVAQTFAALPKAVENVTSGKKPSDVHKLVGGVMKAAKGRAEPKEVMRLVREALGLGDERD